MKLPNGDKAVVSQRKLLGYILNPNHKDGKEHALLFDRLLGINLTNAHLLYDALIKAAVDEDAVLGKPSPYGEKYQIRFQMTGSRGSYTVLSIWMIRPTVPVPHLVTAFID
jgi:hypothetical protein